jgi:hypothetical protein
MSTPPSGDFFEVEGTTAAGAALMRDVEVTGADRAEMARADAILREQWHGQPVVASAARWQTVTPLRLALIVVGALVVVGAIVGPLLWVRQLGSSGGTGVVSDLAQFSRYKQGLSADMGAVSRVEASARTTTSGGSTVWAERSGQACWGVVVSGTSASGVQAQESRLC